MLFTNITDCEMLVFSCIIEAGKEISLMQVMEVLEKKYNKTWKRSTVCTFIGHLIDKGYVASRREGRTFYYSPNVSIKAFKAEQTENFCEIYFNGKWSEMISTVCTAKGASKKIADEVKQLLEEGTK